MMSSSYIASLLATGLHAVTMDKMMESVDEINTAVAIGFCKMIYRNYKS